MAYIGQKAPHFEAEAITQKHIMKLSLNDCLGRYTVLFFYPLDFTFVCPTELHAFQEELPAFKAKQCDVLGISVDSVHTHRAWLETPKAKGGIEGISYPLISDLTKSIARSYGVLDKEKGVALRGLFLLDKNNIIHHASINNFGLGRNVKEVLRLLDALIHNETHGEVCPANWMDGSKALKPTQEGLAEYFG